MARPYPLHFDVVYLPRFSRLQLAIRVLLFILIGMFGFSLGLFFLALYLGLPVFAAICLSEDPPEQFHPRHATQIATFLRWVMAFYAYFALVSDRFPVREPDGNIELELHPGGHPTAGSALLRILYAIPNGLVLGIVLWFASIAWVIAFVLVLIRGRYGHWLFDFQTGVLRWMARLLAYQASIVEPYPPFSLGEAPPAATVPSS